MELDLSDFLISRKKEKNVYRIKKRLFTKSKSTKFFDMEMIVGAFIATVISIGLGIWAVRTKSKGLSTFFIIAGVFTLCISIYGSTSGVKTIHKETAPSLTLASNCDSLFFKSDLNFDGIASEKKMVGYAKIHNTDYEVAKCVWNGKHTIKLIPLNKSGQALATVVDYCRKNKVEKNDSLKLKVRKSYTTVKYKTKQGQITMTAKVSNPDKLIKQIS